MFRFFESSCAFVAALLLIVISIPQPLSANQSADKTNQGLCLELKVDGESRPCNNSMRLDDDGKGTVDLITGFLPSNSTKKLVLNFVTAQREDMENSYGYALRVTAIRTMTFDEPNSRVVQSATGLCFMVKPNPLRAGNREIKQDIVIMCSAEISDQSTKPSKYDWKFVF